MVVSGISEFLHSLVQLLLRTEFIEVGALVLQGIEVPLHWRIVVWIPGFAHALGHMDGSAELYESLRCILAPLVVRRMMPFQDSEPEGMKAATPQGHALDSRPKGCYTPRADGGCTSKCCKDNKIDYTI